MPLLKKQPFVRVKPPPNLKPTDEVFFCEITKEAFFDYDDFFQRTILCNSLVWSCAITGKSNLTFEEALESEEKARKRIGSMPKELKKALLWLASHTKRGRIGEVADDVYEYAKNRFFKGEIVEAIVNDQWVDARVVTVIAPTPEEIAADEEDDDEITEVDKDGSPKKDKEKDSDKFNFSDRLFKYEIEEVEPEDDDMVELHTITSEEIKREKGTFTREKLNVYLKNVMELEGTTMKVKQAGIDIYKLAGLPFDQIFAGPEPVFGQSQRKVPVMNKNKKGQFTLDGWVKGEKTGQAKAGKIKGQTSQAPQPIKQKKQTPEEVEAEMRRIREAQEKYREEMKRRAEESKRKRIEEKAREREKKKEEKRLVQELLTGWTRKRDDLECEDLKELPRPDPVRCSIPNHMFGDFVAILEFLNSFSDILEVKNSYPSGVTFTELETALAEKESPDGALFDILSFMLVTVFDLQLEEEEEVKADSDATKSLDQLDKAILGKDEDIAAAIKSATEVAGYTKSNLGVTLREVHMDQWSLTEVLRLHLESCGAFRGNNLQNWRYQQRGGYRLSDDPGFQFKMDHPEIMTSLQSKTVYELSIGDKLEILNCLMNQMLTYAGVRDEIDTRLETKIESERELKDAIEVERKRIRDMEEEEKKKRKEEKEKNKKKDEVIKEGGEAGKTDGEAGGEQKAAAAPVPPELLMTDRQREALRQEEEKRGREKSRKEELKRSEFHERETALQHALYEAQKRVYVQCLGRDRAYRRFWSFDSIPGIFVEHNDDFVGGCLSEATPWDPEAGPLTEEQAIQRAKEIMGRMEADQKSKNGQPEEEMKLQDVIKTYGRTHTKDPQGQLKQKVLSASNGSLELANKNKVNGDSAEAKDEKPSENEGASAENGQEKTDEDPKEQIPTEPPWGRCEANGDNCPVHSSILPRTHWSYFCNISDLDDLIDSLNPRGIRESELRDRLINERQVLERKLKKCVSKQWLSKEEDELVSDETKRQEVVFKRREKVAKSSGGMALPMGTKLYDCMELALRDQILEVEEKLYLGSLGKLNVKDRNKWQLAIQSREYDLNCDELSWGTVQDSNGALVNRLTPEMMEESEASANCSRAASPEPASASGKRDSFGTSSRGWSSNIKKLAAAILQVGQMINDKEQILKHPLGEDEKERKRRQKEEERRKKEREQEEEDGVVCEENRDSPDSPYTRWENSLMSSNNLGQLFIHLTVLDTSIMWSKSILNTKCRICRRKTDPDKMLLCDGCDRGHHLYCLKPKLKNVPSGDWYCADCKPKERIRSPKKNVRRVFSSTEEDTEDEVDEDEDEEKGRDSAEEDDDDDEEEEEEVQKKVAAKKKTAASKKQTKKKDEASSSKKAAAGKQSKRGSLANLLGSTGRRAAAMQGENKRKLEMDSISDQEEEDEDIDEDEDQEDEQSEAEHNTRRKSSRRDQLSSASRKDQSSLGSNRSARSSRKAKEEENKENSGRSKRRRGDLDDQIELQFNVSGLDDLIKGLIAHKDGWPFDRPITRSDAPDYHKIIAKPMDLCTIRSRLNGLKYSCNQEVLDDIRLMFNNCYQYNHEDAEEYQCGLRLEKYFDCEVRKLGLSEPINGSNNSSSNSKRSRRTF